MLDMQLKKKRLAKERRRVEKKLLDLTHYTQHGEFARKAGILIGELLTLFQN